MQQSPKVMHSRFVIYLHGWEQPLQQSTDVKAGHILAPLAAVCV